MSPWRAMATLFGPRDNANLTLAQVVLCCAERHHIDLVESEDTALVETQDTDCSCCDPRYCFCWGPRHCFCWDLDKSFAFRLVSCLRRFLFLKYAFLWQSLPFCSALGVDKGLPLYCRPPGGSLIRMSELWENFKLFGKKSLFLLLGGIGKINFLHKIKPFPKK